MNVWDIVLPYRWFINRSLRKESDALITHIDEYKVQFDNHNQKLQEELETTKKQYEDEYEKAREDILNRLDNDTEPARSLINTSNEYIAVFFNKKLISKQQEIKQLQIRITNEYIRFLAGHIKEIGTEIAILKRRKIILEQSADISDILQLMQLSGPALAIDSTTSAPGLLEIVRAETKAHKETSDIQKRALMNIETILEERISFAAEVQYITWIIEQKIQARKELNYLKTKQKELLSQNWTEAEQLKKELLSVESRLMATAREIRFFWSKKIIRIETDIAEKYDRKQKCFNEMKNAESELKRMKEDEYYYDPDRKKRFKNQQQTLYEEYEQLKKRIIPNLKTDKCKFINDKKFFIDLLKKHGVTLIKITKPGQTDEELYADVRLQELMTIDKEGREAAEASYQKRLCQISSEKETILKSYDPVITQLELQLAEATQFLAAAQAEYKAAHDADKRFILRHLAPKEEELQAKEKRNLCLQEAKKIESRLKSIQIVRNNKKNEYENKISLLSPQQSRPTAEERSEMKMIRTWMAVQEERKRERKAKQQ